MIIDMKREYRKFMATASLDESRKRKLSDDDLNNTSMTNAGTH